MLLGWLITKLSVGSCGMRRQCKVCSINKYTRKYTDKYPYLKAHYAYSNMCICKYTCKFTCNNTHMPLALKIMCKYTLEYT